MRKVTRIAFITVAILFFLVPNVKAKYWETCEESLKGIRSIFVLVNAHSDLKKLGITNEKIKTDVELKLRTAGINVLSGDLSGIEPGLSVVVWGVEHENLVYYTISVSLRQNVKLSRNLNLECYSKTWESTWAGLTQADRLEQKARIVIKDMIDEFLNEYLTVNSKK